jgi:hypothetical protein
MSSPNFAARLLSRAGMRRHANILPKACYSPTVFVEAARGRYRTEPVRCRLRRK